VGRTWYYRHNRNGRQSKSIIIIRPYDNKGLQNPQSKSIVNTNEIEIESKVTSKHLQLTTRLSNDVNIEDVLNNFDV
jgi:hypothetical protein